MYINPVSGPSSTPNIPPENAGNAAAACGVIFLGRLADTAKALAVSAASATAGISPKGNPTDDLMNDELQALADLSKIHLYLFGPHPDQEKALAAAKEFMALAQKDGFSNADPNISLLTDQIKNYLQIDANKQVVGFKDDAGKTLNDWWGTGTTTDKSGIEIAFDALKSVLNQDTAFGPGVPPAYAGYPGVLVNICILYADLLSTPEGKVLNGDVFWGKANPNTYFSFGTIFPYAMATYAQYMSSIGQGNVNDMMKEMSDLLAEVKPFEGVPTSDFEAMKTEFSALQKAMQDKPGAWPLPQVPGPSQQAYDFYTLNAGTDPQKGIGYVYGIFSRMYSAWLHGL
jgi:hypothetical protein